MATEQGSKAVEVGVKQAGQAGQSIQTLSSSVNAAAQAATQIAASSQQQLVGMEQVAGAMENIKQAKSRKTSRSRHATGGCGAQQPQRRGAEAQVGRGHLQGMKRAANGSLSGINAMSIQDEDFIKKLRATFTMEAEEHLQNISSMLLELEKSPASAGVVENVYREAHSLKGAARAVDLSEIERICQTLEGVFSAWKRQEISPSPDAFDAALASWLWMRSIRSCPSPVMDPALEPGATPRMNRQQELMQIQSPAGSQRRSEPGDAPPNPAAQSAASCARKIS